MDKLKMHTKDAADVNIEAIAKLLPNCITEVKDPDGTARKAVDFDNTQNIYIEGDNLEVLKVLKEA